MISLENACELLLKEYKIFSFIGSAGEFGGCYILRGLDRNGGMMLIPPFSVNKNTGEIYPCTVEWLMKNKIQPLDIPEKFVYKK